MNLLPGPRLSYFQQPWDPPPTRGEYITQVILGSSLVHQVSNIKGQNCSRNGILCQIPKQTKKTFLVRIAYFSSARYSPLLLPLSDTISWPGHWPLIGRERSRDKDTGLWLVECDHVTWILASDWSLMPSCLPDNDIVVENVFPNIKILSNGCGYNLVKRAGFVASFKIGIKFLNTYQIKIVSEI